MLYDFDMVVIGGGAAGLTAAGISASLGAKTALVEAQRLGGDCTWFGCIPSKTLLKAAKVAHLMRTADRYGLTAVQPEFDFAGVMKHIHDVQQGIYEEADAPPNLERLGVEVILGRARFTSPHSIELVNHQEMRRRISSRLFVIATGSTPVVPKIKGVSSSPYLTNETLFSLTKLPSKLIVIGAGPVGIEMAQAFRRLGAEVAAIDRGTRILQHDDDELAGMLKHRLADEGIEFVLGSTVEEVEESAGGILLAVKSRADLARSALEGDALLLAAGRSPNVESLNPEAAEVQADEKGVRIDKHCRTSARNIFACGDVTGLYLFTHMAEHMAKVAITNAVLRFPASIDTASVPWCTYTDPELAHVGASENDLKKRGVHYEVYRFPFSKLDRAITESDDFGLIKVFARSFDGKVLGGSILGANAGEMISEFALALRNKVSLRKMADTIHPYPTFALGNRRAADQWYIRKQSPTLVRWVQRIFGYRGQLPHPEAGKSVM